MFLHNFNWFDSVVENFFIERHVLKNFLHLRNMRKNKKEEFCFCLKLLINFFHKLTMSATFEESKNIRYKIFESLILKIF
jgi:hypothetical protein